MASVDFMTQNQKPKVDSPDAETGPYLVPFKYAVKELGLGSGVPEKFEVTAAQLVAYTAALLRGINFDSEVYLSRYPDIATAVARGDVGSAKEHFVEHGYREGRHFDSVIVDDGWYKKTYPDVAEGIELGEIRSCQEHFDHHGRAEGRLPHAV